MEKTDYSHQKRYWQHEDKKNDNSQKKLGEKTLYTRFNQLISSISHEKTWVYLKKGNFKRESESLFIATQNNSTRINHIKARIDETQQNSKCRLSGNKDKSINHIISECNKLAHKEYKTRLDRVGMVIHWELCKESKFDHTNKWCSLNPASVLKNKTYKLRWDFEIKTDHLISDRRLDYKINKNKKENLQDCGLCCFAGPQSKIERKRKEG